MDLQNVPISVEYCLQHVFTYVLKTRLEDWSSGRVRGREKSGWLISADSTDLVYVIFWVELPPWYNDLVRKSVYISGNYIHASLLLLDALWPRSGNSLPIDIKIAVTLTISRTHVKNWQGPLCHCPVCQLIILILNIARVMALIITLRPIQNGCNLADDAFWFPSCMDTVVFCSKVLLGLFRGPISKMPALIQMMAWRRSGKTPLSESMTTFLLTHICTTRLQPNDV